MVHSILLARLCPEVARVVVSTDSDEIAAAARAYDAEVPFNRPVELAQDETPMWPVVRHALAALDPEGAEYDGLLLLQPTSPGRLPEDVAGAAALLSERRDADGVIGVSEPHFNPIWTAVVDRGGFLADLVPGGAAYGRRQDVPRVLRINGSLYLWRSALVREREVDPRGSARFLGWEIPERRAVDIDTADDLELAELLVQAGQLRLPWLR